MGDVDHMERTRPSSLAGAAKDQYQVVFNLLPQPAWILDRATLRFLAVNDAAIAYYGYSREELLTMDYPAIHPLEETMAVRKRLGSQKPSRGTYAWTQRTRSGEWVITLVSWRPVAFDRMPAILMVAEATPWAVRRLIEEAEESRARLEALSWRLVKLQESERSQIARELHDEVGQLLTGLKLLIASEGGPASTRKGSELTSILDELMGRVRDLSMDLRPPMLDEVGLVPTLGWYFDRYTSRTKVRVTFQHEIGAMRFSSTIELTAFRIVQEALTNVARHAEVGAVLVELRADPDGLRLVIEDKGRGFNPRGALSGHSTGLIGMEERARLVGGHLTLESTFGAGTRVDVVLPLHDGDMDRTPER